MQLLPHVKTPEGFLLILGDPSAQNYPSRKHFYFPSLSERQVPACHPSRPHPHRLHLPREDFPDLHAPSTHPSHQATLQLLAHMPGVPEGWCCLVHPRVPRASPDWLRVWQELTRRWGLSQAGAVLDL